MKRTMIAKRGGVNWDDARLLQGARAGLIAGVLEGAVLYTDAVKEAVSLPGPKTKRQLKRMTAGERDRVQTSGVELRASLPGEPPRKRTGILRSSVMMQPVSGGTVQRCGYSMAAPYGPYLEFGTANMEPRPALRLVMARLSRDIMAIIRRRIAESIAKAGA